jgi:heat shock protein HtpX
MLYGGTYVAQIFKTTILLAALTGLFLGVGYMVGGQGGALIALLIAAAMNFGMYWFSGSLVLKTQGAKPLDEKEHANIVKMVRELTQADGLPMPKLYYVDTPLPNAFATGRNPKNAVVAVTDGITQILNDAELKAVIGHELGHVKNRDMLVSTIAATLAGAISWIANLAFFFGGSDEDSPNPIALFAMIILAPIAAMLVQMAVSRSREFLADQHGAGLVGGGRDLANALQKLEDFKMSVPPIQPSPTQQSQAHLMFANMFSARGLAGLFSTHPSTQARVARLREFDKKNPSGPMAGGPILERR